MEHSLPTASFLQGQAKSLKSEDLLAMVIKLQKEGSLEPQIEDLINRINELQQEALRILQLHCQEKETSIPLLIISLISYHLSSQQLTHPINCPSNHRSHILVHHDFNCMGKPDVS
ncbi:hypothetical protein P7K49_036780 [Saguinus oedipus]|uniref:Uncharacterized protein n=1 Tax=Saguinus oedipus TaxID=9490 RepID=A0ABQ9TLS2_SAGOE|nr:hypothetical protein P7K49_036780 [Saguinus oedipus]